MVINSSPIQQENDNVINNMDMGWIFFLFFLYPLLISLYKFVFPLWYGNKNKIISLLCKFIKDRNKYSVLKLFELVEQAL